MTRAPRCAVGEFRASRIGASIRALPDLRFEIVSEPLVSTRLLADPYMAGRSCCVIALTPLGLAGHPQVRHAAEAAGEGNHAELQSRASPNYARGPSRLLKI